MPHRSPTALWTPTATFARDTRLRAYMDWLAAERGIHVATYDELWHWSVDDLDAFWASIATYFDVHFHTPPEAVLEHSTVADARWFAGATLSYPEHVFRDRDDDAVAIRHASELRPLAELTWAELRSETARIQAGLRALGVDRGDRVAAYLPNLPETVAAFLATAGLGAVWSSCAPEFGARAVVDRFAQIEPAVLLAVDGYRYGGRDFDRAQIVERIHAEVGGALVQLGHLDGSGWQDGFLGSADAQLELTPVAFGDPLWILYSSGTTGLPKAIVQGHGGILLEQLKHQNLHLDMHAEDRAFWFTTTGWMMWNFLVGVLLTPASIVLYDGSPSAPTLDTLWQLAADAGITCFGTSAAFIAGCQKANAEPAGAGRDLGALRSIGSTGSPLATEGFRWIYDELDDDTWLFSMSGGTDVCTAFVGGVPLLPVYEGELQARSLGCDVQAFDEHGRPLTDAVGELVLTQPMPSMPLALWNDPGGERLQAAYFDAYPGVWRHGDWIEITSRGTAIISGRSDATINRGGVRMGTSEIYRAVLALDEIVDALIVDVDGWMALFVVLRAAAELDDDLRAQIARRIREDCSPRHVPDDVYAVAGVPRTLSGKLLEVPVKRILAGADPADVASRDSLANPDALDWFSSFACSRTTPTDAS
ncbi:MAG TPA: acetoacetate--CoA ligase [Solirubrobacteraceae bacterium]|jgi:acetoacetyl-CoA synthetase|nr:acetoacetate--CoA ligase [Solirubrobacteraceae bacterium]